MATSDQQRIDIRSSDACAKLGGAIAGHTKMALTQTTLAFSLLPPKKADLWLGIAQQSTRAYQAANDKAECFIWSVLRA